MSTIARSASRRLGELLMERAGLTPEQVAHALAARTDPRERLGQVIVRLGYLTEADVVQALAQQFGLPVADVQRLTGANREAVQLVPEQLARQAHVLALAREGNTLEIAVGDPLDVLSLDHLRALTGCATHTRSRARWPRRSSSSIPSCARPSTWARSWTTSTSPPLAPKRKWTSPPCASRSRTRPSSGS